MFQEFGTKYSIPRTEYNTYSVKFAYLVKVLIQRVMRYKTSFLNAKFNGRLYSAVKLLETTISASLGSGASI